MQTIIGFVKSHSELQKNSFEVKTSLAAGEEGVQVSITDENLQVDEAGPGVLRLTRIPRQDILDESGPGSGYVNQD